MPEDDNEDPQPEKLARQRRRKAVLAVPALLLAAGLAAAFLVDGSDDDESTVRVAAPTSTSRAVPRTVPRTTTPVESTTSTSPSASSTSTPTTVATTDSTDVPPTSEPSNQPPEPRCEPSHFTATGQPDKTFYRLGEEVRITGTFTNISGATCYWVSTQSTLEVRDSAGRLVGPPTAMIADGFQWSPIGPGETTSHGMSWDQRICDTAPCVPAPRGQYTATLNVDPFGSASTSFTLLPA